MELGSENAWGGLPCTPVASFKIWLQSDMLEKIWKIVTCAGVWGWKCDQRGEKNKNAPKFFSTPPDFSVESLWYWKRDPVAKRGLFCSLLANILRVQKHWKKICMTKTDFVPATPYRPSEARPYQWFREKWELAPLSRPLGEAKPYIWIKSR